MPEPIILAVDWRLLARSRADHRQREGDRLGIRACAPHHHIGWRRNNRPRSGGGRSCPRQDGYSNESAGGSRVIAVCCSTQSEGTIAVDVAGKSSWQRRPVDGHARGAVSAQTNQWGY